MEVALLEKLSVFAARTHILPFLKDFDRLNTRRIEPEQGVRALLSAGLALSAQEQAQVKAAYTGDDGKFVYDALIGDGAWCGRRSVALCSPWLAGGLAGLRAGQGAPFIAPQLLTLHAASPSPLTSLFAVNNVRPVGYFEGNPDQDAGMSSPRARFNFTGVCSPTLFAPRAQLSEAEEGEVQRVLRELRAEAQAHALNLASFLKPFDKTHRGSVTTSRFVRQLLTQFRRINARDAAVLCRAYAAADDNVRYAALSRDIGVGEAEGASERSSASASASARSASASASSGSASARSGGGGGGGGSSSSSGSGDGGASARSISPAARLERTMAEPVHSEVVKEGFRLLIRTLHERRMRIGDVLRDFGRFSPFPGRITKEQLVRGLSSVGGAAAAIAPGVMLAIAGTYSIRSDPQWVDYEACIRDLEATTYLRHLEQNADPDAQNLTFSAAVAQSPNPRKLKARVSAEEEVELAALLKELADKCARNRVFNVRVFASQYDTTKEGFLTVDRFTRALSTLHILPPTQRGVALLVKHYGTPKGIDYNNMLLDLNLS